MLSYRAPIRGAGLKYRLKGRKSSMIGIISRARTRVWPIANTGEPEEAWYRRLVAYGQRTMRALRGGDLPVRRPIKTPNKEVSTAFPLLCIQQPLRLPVLRDTTKAAESRAIRTLPVLRTRQTAAHLIPRASLSSAAFFMHPCSSPASDILRASAISWLACSALWLLRLLMTCS
jgi:hypothetical protein